ncbi:hypothetical protein DES36_101176 [Alkalibaculum bacchi]|uniref:Uncharacterized protein n=1 Tax=Alkalibaculum bacchi TaxID=645887 RepID=A0A366IFJ2_9FIRM|nr:hypothetical protein [Alkalibaculum bacchi]RBP70121.1 hypothetical protein DES36_101176 [Alkalibaculum bacchi]
MQVQINEECKITVKNDSDEILKTIYDNTIVKGININYLVVDGLPVYNNFPQFIDNNVKVIKKIQVITQSIPNLIKSTLFRTETYIKELLKTLESFIDKHEEMTKNSAQEFTNILIEDIYLIQQTQIYINALVSEEDTIRKYSLWKIYTTQVKKLSELGISLEKAKDKNIEFIQIFKDILNVLEEIKRAAEFIGSYIVLCG